MKKGLGPTSKSLSTIENAASHVEPQTKQELVSEAKELKMNVEKSTATGRINPQLSCTITPEDKELLSDITLYFCNKERKVLNTSIIVRALIRLGNKYKNELELY